MQVRRLLVAVVAMAALQTALAGEPVYRWVDDEGRVHYSDQPPTGIDAERVTIPVSEPARTPVDEDAARKAELAERLAADAEARAAYDAEQQAAIERACADARARLADLESARKVTRIGKDGALEYYNDEQREAALAEARAQVREWCR